MKLYNATIRPGRVLEVIDNKGTIRASAPGLFCEDDKDNLPPITPLLAFHSNAFTTPNKDDEVWIMNFSDNSQQLYWFRKDNYSANNEMQEEQNVEILCNRESGLGYATIYFSDNSGWVIKNDGSTIQLDPDGNITLKLINAHRCIQLNPENISIGSEGKSKYHATYSEPLETILQRIALTIETIQKAAQTSAYTTNISTAIEAIGTDWKNNIPDIESMHVTID